MAQSALAEIRYPIHILILEEDELASHNIKYYLCN